MFNNIKNNFIYLEKHKIRNNKVNSEFHYNDCLPILKYKYTNFIFLDIIIDI